MAEGGRSPAVPTADGGRGRAAVRAHATGPEARAGLRLSLALLALVPLALVLGPAALLVHEGWAPLLRVDGATSAAAERLSVRSPQVAEAAGLLTHVGDPFVVTLLAGAAALLLWRTGHRRSALFLVLVRLGALLLSQVTKLAVGRARPAFEDPVASAFGASFPSGHALGAAAVYTGLAVVLVPLVGAAARRALLVAGLLVPVLVASTRVLIGVHYLSDVVAGVVLGVAWTCVCTAVFVVWRHEEDPGRDGSASDVLQEGVEAAR